MKAEREECDDSSPSRRFTTTNSSFSIEEEHKLPEPNLTPDDALITTTSTLEFVPSTCCTEKKRKKIKAKRVFIPPSIFDKDILLIGDLVWAKIAGHPWWPSMIAYDPNSAAYFSIRSTYIKKYHVQFFGIDSLRGWVDKLKLVKFCDFEELLKAIKPPTGHIPALDSSRRPSWERAILQANQALPLSRQERKLAYIFNYEANKLPPLKKANKLPKSAKSTDLISDPFTKIVTTQSQPIGNSGVIISPLACKGSEIKQSNLPTIDKKVSQPREKISLSNYKSVFSSESVLGLWYHSISSGENNGNDSGFEEDNVNQKAPIFITDIEEDIALIKRAVQVQENSDNDTDSDKENMAESKRIRKPPKGFDEFHTGFASKRKKSPSETSEDSQTSQSETDTTKGNLTRSKSLTSQKDKPSLNYTSLRKFACKPIPSNEENSTDNLSDSVTKLATESRIQPEKANGLKIKRETRSSSPHRKSGSSTVPHMDNAKTVSQKPKTKQKAPASVKSEPNKSAGKQARKKLADQAKRNIERKVESLLQEEATGIQDKNKDDLICALCELPSSKVISCAGSCFNSFHLDCLGLHKAPVGDFVCDECMTGQHTCFVCGEAGRLRKCTQAFCGKHYHQACLKDAFFEENKIENKFLCPLHTCQYCTSDNEDIQPGHGRLLKCIKCPRAYHSQTCIVAGSAKLTSQHIICEKHAEPDKLYHVNVTWCFVCSTGGSLVCCDSCPASFHVGCHEDLDHTPDGPWQCKACSRGERARYDDVVWVKFGCWRWWPAQIQHDTDVPERVAAKKHVFGEFAVRFFGSHDYCWLRHSRCFVYNEGDNTGEGAKPTGILADHFKKALEEAKEAHRVLQETRKQDAEIVIQRKSNKPPAYGHIRQNRAISCVRTTLDPSEWPVCECSARYPCNSDEDCLNRMLQHECGAKMCRAGAACQNQRFQRCEYAKTQSIKCEERGWGLKTLQDIKKGDFVIEYVGELIDEATCQKRIKEYHDKDINDYYFLTIDKDNIIDAYPKANASRFMNHSCDPNCDTQKWTVNGDVRVGLFANRDITIGEELCFNYNLDCMGNEKKQCRCGSVNCSGFLGVPPKTQHSMSVAEKAKEKKMKPKKLKKKVERTVHEDECFVCGDGGELILCSRIKCTKSYHIECLKLEAKPKGNWECPWHFCDECGKKSASLCLLCTNSFCDTHKDGEMIIMEGEGVQICIDHEEDEIRQLFIRIEEEKREAEEKQKKASSSSSSDSDTTSNSSDSNGTKKNSTRKSLDQKQPTTGNTLIDANPAKTENVAEQPKKRELKRKKELLETESESEPLPKKMKSSKLPAAKQKAVVSTKKEKVNIKNAEKGKKKKRK